MNRHLLIQVLGLEKYDKLNNQIILLSPINERLRSIIPGNIYSNDDLDTSHIDELNSISSVLSEISKNLNEIKSLLDINTKYDSWTSEFTSVRSYIIAFFEILDEIVEYINTNNIGMLRNHITQLNNLILDYNANS